MEQAIPVIDLLSSPSDHDNILTACEGIGCFRVINHGIPAVLQAETKAAVKSLFDLPDDVKRRNAGSSPGVSTGPPWRRSRCTRRLMFTMLRRRRMLMVSALGGVLRIHKIRPCPFVSCLKQPSLLTKIAGDIERLNVLCEVLKH